jgi:hypothetical protein
MQVKNCSQSSKCSQSKKCSKTKKCKRGPKGDEGPEGPTVITYNFSEKKLDNKDNNNDKQIVVSDSKATKLVVKLVILKDVDPVNIPNGTVKLTLYINRNGTEMGTSMVVNIKIPEKNHGVSTCNVNLKTCDLIYLKADWVPEITGTPFPENIYSMYATLKTIENPSNCCW